MTEPAETPGGLPPAFVAAVRVLAPPFFGEGVEEVYVSWDGDRIYVGAIPAGAFRDKPGTPENIRISEADLATL
jgi:hypothetical protein